MKVNFAVAAILVLTACGGTGTKPPSATAIRAYSGTASVGDFLNISLDPTAQTLSYTNLSNKDTGTVPYTVNSDGTYSLTDPTGNLVSAFEVPNYALLIESDKAGPNHNALALVTSVETSPITIASLAGKQYNYMQFRTSSGGVEAGSVIIDAQGNVSTSSYWPYGALGMGQAPNPFNGNSFPSSQIQEDPSGTFLELTENQQQNASVDYIFGTPSGVFVVDSANGAILGFKKAASKAFDPSMAGSYKALYYKKTGASTNQNNQETGTPSLGHATVVIDANAGITVADTQGNIMLQATLTPVADAAYLYGTPGELTDPCWGLFTFRVMRGLDPQDVFVTFVNGATLFSSFNPQSQTGSGYDYLYGVGLK